MVSSFENDIAQLVSGCKNGDNAAMAHLYRRYAPRLLAHCRRIIANEALSHDIVHDAFVVIYTSVNQLRDPNKLEAWMTRVVERTAFQYLRDERRKQSAEQQVAFEESFGDDDNPLLAISYDELMAMVGSLPAGYNNVFRLAVFEDLNHKQIGKLLGINAHSSSSQLWHAREALRRMIRRYGLPAIGLLLACGIAFYFPVDDRSGENHVAESKTHPVSVQSSSQSDDRQSWQEPETIQEPSRPAHDNIVHRQPSRSMSAPVNTVTKTIAETGVVQPKTDNVLSIDTITATEQPQLAMERDTLHPLPPLEPLPEHYACNDILSARRHSAGSWEMTLACDNPLVAATNKIMNEYQITSSPSQEIDFEQLGQIYNNAASNSSYSNFSSNLSDIINRNNSGTDPYDVLPTTRTIRETHHHSMPLQFSLSLTKDLSRRFAVGTGLTFTQLKSTFVISNGDVGETSRQRISYIGIPLQLKLNLWQSSRLRIYTTACATLDLPVSSRTTNLTFLSSQEQERISSHFHVSPQWSLQMGLGADYRIAPHLSVFAQPGAAYYFSNGTITYRSAHPFTVTIPAGLRLTW